MVSGSKSRGAYLSMRRSARAGARILGVALLQNGVPVAGSIESWWPRPSDNGGGLVERADGDEWEPEVLPRSDSAAGELAVGLNESHVEVAVALRRRGSWWGLRGRGRGP